MPASSVRVGNPADTLSGVSAIRHHLAIAPNRDTPRHPRNARPCFPISCMSFHIRSISFLSPFGMCTTLSDTLVSVKCFCCDTCHTLGAPFGISLMCTTIQENKPKHKPFLCDTCHTPKPNKCSVTQQPPTVRTEPTANPDQKQCDIRHTIHSHLFSKLVSNLSRRRFYPLTVRRGVCDCSEC